LKGLIIADAFREFNIIKKAYFLEDLSIKEDYTDIEWAQLMYSYTSLKPKLDVLKAFDFGKFHYTNINDFKDSDANKIKHIRGIVTQIVNKDKLLRQDLKDHQFKFEQHMIYLNVNDGTGNIAVQINPAAYEIYQDKISSMIKKPVSILGRASADGKKLYADIIQVVGLDIQDRPIDDLVQTIRSCNKNEAVIFSAQPAISKKKNSYYRVILHNKIQGMVFNLKNKLIPGMKFRYSFQEPFIKFFYDDEA
jgi:hypothetical protein